MVPLLRLQNTLGLQGTGNGDRGYEGTGRTQNIYFNSDQTGHLVRALFGGGEDGGDGEEGCRDRRTPQLSCCPVARNHRWRGKQP